MSRGRGGEGGRLGRGGEGGERRERREFIAFFLGALENWKRQMKGGWFIEVLPSPLPAHHPRGRPEFVFFFFFLFVMSFLLFLVGVLGARYWVSCRDGWDGGMRWGGGKKGGRGRG